MKKIEVYETINILVLALITAFMLTDKSWLLVAALFLLLNNVLMPVINALLALLWLKLASILGHINTHILLSIIYLLILAPLAFFYRIFNSNLLLHYKKNLKASFFEEVRDTYSKDNFEKQW